MKIGLLTFHRAHNYGALLQSYALSQELSKYGQCEVIDYINENHNYKLISRYKGIKTKIKALFRIFLLIKRYRNMEKFINILPLSKQYTKRKLITTSPEVDILVTGSDQIWNCRDYNSVYFLDFPTKAKRVAYAASFGKSVIPDKLKLDIGKLLGAYNNISVRENSAVQLLKKEYQLNTTEAIDPVFLMTAEEWRAIQKPYNIKDKYILVYLLEIKPVAKKVIEYLKKSTRLPVYSVTTINSGKAYGSDYDIIDAGPEQFLWLIDNAEYIVTSSFHGTSFSVIFQKNFYSIPKSDTSERVIDLLNSLELQDRIIKDENISLDKINYSTTMKLLNDKIDFSKSYLSRAIKNS